MNCSQKKVGLGREAQKRGKKNKSPHQGLKTSRRKAHELNAVTQN